jgi:hypothetical protein
MSDADWKRRREAAADRLYGTALGKLDKDPKGRFFAEADTLGWYVFLADAFLDHVWNYEPVFGSRVVPIIDARTLGTAGLSELGRSAFCDAHLGVPLDELPADYLTGKTKQWLASELPSLVWRDHFGFGVIGELDLDPLQSVLVKDDVMAAGTRILELLTGRYVRHANYVQVLHGKHSDNNPRYLKACDQAIVLRWESTASEAIDAKARTGSSAGVSVPPEHPRSLDTNRAVYDCRHKQAK